MGTVKDLGYQELVDYVLKNSNLKKDQFTFAMTGGDGYSHFIVAKNNKLLFLGQFSYERFIRVEYGSCKEDLFAISKFLDLCIHKLEDETVQVPMLTGNPDMWDEIYKS